LDIDSLHQSTRLSKPLALAAGLAVLYLCFLTASHYWDGVLFSLYIEKVAHGVLPFPTLLHANHLLYSPLGYMFYQILHLLRLPVRSISTLQFLNVLASVCCSFLVFRLSRRSFESADLARSCTLLFALGATWWKFSTDANAYIISVLLCVAAVSCVLAMRMRLALAGVCLGLAMLFHELAVLGYVPIVAGIWSEQMRRKERVRRALTFVLLTSACVGGIYYVAYLWTHSDQSAQPFIQWVTSVSNDTKTTHSLGQLVASNAASYLKLFGGGKLGLIRDFLSPPVIVALLICLACATATVITAIRTSGGEASRRPATGRRTQIVLWSWVAAYLVFLSWFEPGNAFYKLFAWPPIVVLIGYYLGRYGRVSAAFRWFTLGLASWNFAAFIYPHSRVEADPVLSLAKRIDKELPISATVYYKALSPDDWYLEYFAPGRRWEPLGNPNQIRKASAAAPVCFESTALPYVQAETDPSLAWRLVNSQHNIRLECVKARPD
jgi:hypothetical protein